MDMTRYWLTSEFPMTLNNQASGNTFSQKCTRSVNRNTPYIRVNSKMDIKKKKRKSLGASFP